MLNKTIRILNFDDSVAKQKKLLSSHHCEIVDLKGLGPKARYWISPAVEKEITARLRHSPKGGVAFLGSGDFHHISDILISEHDGPLSVIDFDLHPDWDIHSLRTSCGSWVTRSLLRRNILKFILVGVSSYDISSVFIQRGDLGSLADDRMEIYPYTHQPSTVFLRHVPDNISIEVKRYPFFSRISWNELRNKNPVELFIHILNRLPTKNVYLTIDKDCLTIEDALTNWEEGFMSLDELLVLLKLVREHCEIVGADVVGDYSDYAQTEGFLKRAVSYLDHPKRVKARGIPEELVTAANEKTNLKILEILLGA